MHAHHFVASGFALGMLALLVPACAASVDTVPEESEKIASTADAVNEPPIDVTARIVCKGLNVVQCMIRCSDAGTACFKQRIHPHNPAVGNGDLFACRTSTPRSCDYRYPNGDLCYFFKSPAYEWCRHTRN